MNKKVVTVVIIAVVLILLIGVVAFSFSDYNPIKSSKAIQGNPSGEIKVVIEPNFDSEMLDGK